MIPVPRRSSRVFLMGIGGLLVCTGLLNYSEAANKVERKFTAQQILDRAEPICRAIASDQRELRLSADCTVHRPRSLWNVTCTDPNGVEIASLQWDDNTGELLSIGVTVRSAPVTHLLVQTSRQARASAMRWLTRLGICTDERLMQLDCESRNLSSQSSYTPLWLVHCRFTRHTVTLHIDAARDLPSFAIIARRKAP